MRLLIALLAAAVTLGVSAPAWADRPAPDGVFARTAPAPAAGHILMVDTCKTPSLASIKTWQSSSPYRAIAVYIPATASFDARACKTQENLTSDWVSQVRAGGWQVLPIYVGLQASCASSTKYGAKRMSASAATARSQGAAMAQDAAASVYRLGLPVGAPIAYDLEGYPTGKATCSAAAQAMQAGWTSRLHQLGRNSAVYGSVNSTITDITNASTDPTYAKPDAIWVARWDGVPDTTFTSPAGISSMWVGRRMHQFAGGGDETYGGVTLNIDASAVQAGALALPPPDSTPPTLAVAATRITRAAHPTLKWTMRDAAGVARYQVQIRTGRHWTSPKELRKTRKVQRRVTITAGQKACVRARGTDRAGNTSGWQTSCIYRWGKGTAFHGAGWQKHGSSLATKGRAKAKGPVVTGRTISVQTRGRGTSDLIFAGRVIATFKGSGIHRVTLPTTKRGRLVVRPHQRGKLTIVGYLATP